MPPTSESDPLGFVTNPPSTIVKVVNTAREDMNGQLGIVVQFQQERGRYLVHMTQTQAVVAMKPENLIKGSYVDQAQAYYQQATRDPQIQQIVTRMSSYLPPGVSLRHVGLGMGLVIFTLIYLLGFSRTMMLMSFSMMILMVIGQDLLQGANSNTILRNAPMRFRTLVREQVAGGNYLVGKSYEQYVHLAFAAFLLVFFVKSMMPVSTTTAAPPTDNNNFSGTTPGRNLMMNRKTAEEYYKLGFDDATAQKLYGASLPADLSADDPTSAINDNGMDDFPDYPMPPMSRNNNSMGGMFGKLFNFGSAMSVMYLGRTAMELGRDANGSWSFPLFRQNLVTLEPWKLGLLGLSLYRLVAGVLGK